MQGSGRSIVEVENLSKLYARSSSASRARAARTFRQVLFGGRRGKVPVPEKSEFWALDNINFRLERGEALGIIGLNGSGKTTLLRLLGGQLLPDVGEIRLGGTTASLIDLTAGFRMPASGKENIYLKGAMLGRSRAEMNAMMDEIIEFTELGDAIHAPMTSYSSGMIMRLAFAINLASQAEILLIDETLAVGDFRFRQKCFARLREVRDQSCFVLVSHAMGDIRRFCTRVIVLNRGKVAFEGEPEKAIEFYENMEFGDSVEERKQGLLSPWFRNEDAIQDIESMWCDKSGEPIARIRSGEHLSLLMSFKLAHKPRNLIIGVPMWSETGQYVTGFSTELTGSQFDVDANKRLTFRLDIPALPLNPGSYISNLAITDGPEFMVRLENPVLEVTPSTSLYWGCVTLPHSWQHIPD